VRASVLSHHCLCSLLQQVTLVAGHGERMCRESASFVVVGRVAGRVVELAMVVVGVVLLLALARLKALDRKRDGR